MRMRKLANAELSAFCLELHEIWHAGLPMSEGLLSLCDGEDGQDSRPWMERLCQVAQEGYALSDALAQVEVFPDFMVNALRLADHTGQQEETLSALSEYYERSDRIAQSARSAALYPALLTVVMLVVIAVLITKVLPIFESVFLQLGVQMSGVTRELMQFGRALSGASAALGVAIAVIVVLALFVWFVPVLHIRAGEILSRLFGNRGIPKRVAATKFTSAMAMAVQSGLDIEEAVRAAANVCGDIHTQHKAEQCIQLLEQGERISNALKNSGLLPPRTCRIIGLGERTGSQGSLFAEVARRSEQEVDDAISRTLGWIEPILVIAASAVVGTVLLSALLPLLSILSAVG